MEDLKVGYKMDAINKFKKISSRFSIKYGFIENYAKALYYSGRTIEAISLMEQQHKNVCNHRYHSTLGSWYAEIGDSINAKENLEMALYIAPQYLQSRLNLLNFYSLKKDTVRAKYWAKQILECPIKIPSPRANEIKKIASKYLENKIEF